MSLRAIVFACGVTPLLLWAVFRQMDIDAAKPVPVATATPRPTATSAPDPRGAEMSQMFFTLFGGKEPFQKSVRSFVAVGPDLRIQTKLAKGVKSKNLALEICQTSELILMTKEGRALQLLGIEVFDARGKLRARRFGPGDSCTAF